MDGGCYGVLGRVFSQRRDALVLRFGRIERNSEGLMWRQKMEGNSAILDQK